MQIPRQQPIYIAPTMAPRPTRTVGVSHAQPAFGASQPKPAEAKTLPWHTRAWNWSKRVWADVKYHALNAWWNLTSPVYRTIHGNRGKEATAIHELGHALILKGLGFDKFKAITVVSDKTSNSRGHVHRDVEALIHFVEQNEFSGRLKLTLESYAGDALLALQRGITDKEAFYAYAEKWKKMEHLICFSQGIENNNGDMHKAKDWADSLRKLHPELSSEKIMKDSFDVVKSLHQTIGSEKLNAMAKDLVNQKSISGEKAIHQFFEKHLGANFSWLPVEKAFEKYAKTFTRLIK